MWQRVLPGDYLRIARDVHSGLAFTIVIGYAVCSSSVGGGNDQLRYRASGRHSLQRRRLQHLLRRPSLCGRPLLTRLLLGLLLLLGLGVVVLGLRLLFGRRR